MTTPPKDDPPLSDARKEEMRAHYRKAWSNTVCILYDRESREWWAKVNPEAAAKLPPLDE